MRANLQGLQIFLFYDMLCMQNNEDIIPVVGRDSVAFAATSLVILLSITLIHVGLHVGLHS